MRDTVVYRTPYTFCRRKRRGKNEIENIGNKSIYMTYWGKYIPFRLIDRYNGLLAHKMFWTTQETSIRVNSHSWGLKAICHDALEPIRPGPRAERSSSRDARGDINMHGSTAASRRPPRCTVQYYWYFLPKNGKYSNIKYCISCLPKIQDFGFFWRQ